MGNTASASAQTVADGLKGAELNFDALIPNGAALPVLDVFYAISPEAIREMKSQHPRNLALLIVKCTDMLVSAVTSPDPAQYTGVMNAVRLLTRIVPIVLEGGPADAFVANLFWNNQLPAAASKPGAVVWEARQPADAPAVGTLLVQGVMGACFLPDLTIDRPQYEAFLSKLQATRASSATTASAAAAAAAEGGEGEAEQAEEAVVPDEANAVWPMLLWKGGIGFPQVSSQSVKQLAPRLELLRLLISLCSETLYQAAAPPSPARSRFLDELVGGTCPFAPTLFYSLLNTVLLYDPVGFGVPYANSVVGDAEEPLANASLQALLLLLDYAPLVPAEPQPQAQAAAAADGAAEAAAAAQPANLVSQFNIYRSMLGSMEGVALWDGVYDCVARLLNNVPAVEGAMLPSAYSKVACYQELLVLLWKLLDENKGFCSHVLTACDVNQVVTPILYFMWSGRDNITKVGLIHLCTFILLLLSGDRAFGVGLNRAYVSKLPFGDMPLFDGSHADLLIITLHRIIVDGSPKLVSLYSCFLTIITNISPYAKGLSLVTAIKLTNLFDLFAAPRFLLSKASNFTYAQSLLEVFNNLLQYEYETNGVLVYSIVRRKEAFERLAGLTVAGWKAELEVRAARKAARTGAATGAAAAAAAAPAMPGSPAGTGLQSASADSSPVRSRAGTGSGSGAGEGAAAAAALTAATEAPAADAVAAAAAAAAAPAPAPAPAAAPSTAWVPTEEWLSGVKAQLPLETVLCLLGYLGPLVEDYVRAHEGATDDEAVVEFIKATTLVGILPVPHPIFMRKYAPNNYTGVWFTTFLWSTVFLHLCRDVPLFDAAAIKLFTITVV